MGLDIEIPIVSYIRGGRVGRAAFGSYDEWLEDTATDRQLAIVETLLAVHEGVVPFVPCTFERVLSKPSYWPENN
jgi:hypothetical protein